MEIRKAFGDFDGAVGGAVRSGCTDSRHKLLILYGGDVERETGFEPVINIILKTSNQGHIL